MAQTSAGGRETQLAAILRAAGAGQPKPVYLFAGEPFATAAAAQQLLAVLVPPERRSFNLETYDGRTTPVATVLDSLRTPGFFAGTKVVWLRECTLLLSAEKRSEVTQALFAAWSEGHEQEAAEKLLTLAALAGWSKDEFQATRYTSLSKTRAPRCSAKSSTWNSWPRSMRCAPPPRRAA